MEAMGFHVTHLYGLTESYGPATSASGSTAGRACRSTERAALHGAAGREPSDAGGDRWSLDPATMQPVPADGATMGEIMLRGNTVMKGYLKNPRPPPRRSPAAGSTPAISRVLHPDGYVEVKDRAKDIIISGGENISSLEVEEVLYPHPADHGGGRGGPARREMGRDAAAPS